jgi:biotin carboxyl carrier protein
VTAEIKSPAVGTIVEVLVAAGAVVAAGDELVVVESMKVEIPVPAPCGGQVAALAVAPGDHVEAGTLLLTLEG